MAHKYIVMIKAKGKRAVLAPADSKRELDDMLAWLRGTPNRPQQVFQYSPQRYTYIPMR